MGSTPAHPAASCTHTPQPGRRRLYASARRAIILVVGLTVVAAGAVLLVTPGPAIVVIPLGLAILATEFVWARRLLTRVRQGGEEAGKGLLGVLGLRKQPRQDDADPGGREGAD